MKLTFAILLVVCAAASVSAYTRIKQNAVDPKTPGKCYDSDTKKYYNVGNNAVEGSCERAHCSLNDHELTYTGCNKINSASGCTIKKGKTQGTYPECCDTKVCD